MSFRVKVNISIVNEDGEEVNYKGYPGVVGRPFTALATEQEFKEFESINAAQETMNALFKIVESIGEIA
jgi:hypothetical protein